MIRAWDWRHAGFAMVASILAALVMVGTIGELTGVAAGQTDPGLGADPIPLPVRVDGRDVESLWFRVALTGQPGPQPPLGWTLAPSTVDDMRAQLSTEQNRVAIAQLRHLLTVPLRCG